MHSVMCTHQLPTQRKKYKYKHWTIPKSVNHAYLKFIGALLNKFYNNSTIQFKDFKYIYFKQINITLHVKYAYSLDTFHTLVLWSLSVSITDLSCSFLIVKNESLSAFQDNNLAAHAVRTIFISTLQGKTVKQSKREDKEDFLCSSWSERSCSRHKK